MKHPPDYKSKRAAPARATRQYQRTHNTNDSAINAQPQGFVVLCTKAHSTKVPFQSYATRSEAEAVASHLRRVGCPVDVEALR